MENLDRYGHFDDERGEFVVTCPHTPSPWINYLSNGTFHTMISQTGGGLYVLSGIHVYYSAIPACIGKSGMKKRCGRFMHGSTITGSHIFGKVSMEVEV